MARKSLDVGLAHLANIKSLTQLHLERTAVTDAGLAHLSGLENLEYLNLMERKSLTPDSPISKT